MRQHPEQKNKHGGSHPRKRTRIIHKDAGLKPGATSLLQEGGSGLEELGPASTEDGAVAGVGNDPQAGVRDSFGHFDGEFDGIKRVAVALDDESAGLNGGRSEERRVGKGGRCGWWRGGELGGEEEG